MQITVRKPAVGAVWAVGVAVVVAVAVVLPTVAVAVVGGSDVIEVATGASGDAVEAGGTAVPVTPVTSGWEEGVDIGGEEILR